jgi:uncharacterized protein
MTASLGITSPPDQVTTADYGHTDITNVVNISRALIEPLRAAGTGVLINVASMAAYQPNPNMAVYGATKAFVLNFTEALWQESQGTGLRVLALSPGATKPTSSTSWATTPRAVSGCRPRSRSSTPPFGTGPSHAAA